MKKRGTLCGSYDQTFPEYVWPVSVSTLEL